MSCWRVWIFNSSLHCAEAHNVCSLFLKLNVFEKWEVFISRQHSTASIQPRMLLFSFSFPLKRTVSQQVTLALAALWPIPKILLDIISKGHSVLADLGVYGGVHTLGHGWRGSGDTVCHVEILQYLLWWRQRVRAECSVAYLQQNGGRRKYYKRQVNSRVELHTCNEKNRKKELKSVKSMHKHLSCQDSYPQEYMTVRLRPQAPPKIPPTQNRTTYHQRFHNTEQDSLRTTKDSTHTEYASLCTTKDSTHTE